MIASGGFRSCLGHFGRDPKREIELEIAGVLFMDVVWLFDAFQLTTFG